MRIGFDGKRATQNFTGLGNYSRYILNILSIHFPENTYQLYSQKEPQKTGLIDSKITLIGPEKGKLSFGWRSFGIVKDLKKNKIDLYHGLSNEIPFGIKKASMPSIVTIHDLIFLRFPQYYNFIDRKIYAFKFRYACKNADKIIAVSEQTKQDIVHFFGIKPQKISVIYQNCTSEFNTVETERKHEIAIKYQLPEKYILNVGSIEERKNILVVVKALKSINPDIHLVIVGKETVYSNKVERYIEENNLASRVRILKNVPFVDLPSIF
ncbi:MAG: pglJ 2, partial [Daejeonella sp.]|nr:pglJ 2 [Daejeonella sp.]